ncbi:MAG: enoyl-CoA hydratase/isomerase family protein, partial [Acidobacteria bacterium]|nr:enoyl-CoA hydratase/isomerase family protein [Acidobacteriota bacterium]
MAIGLVDLESAGESVRVVRLARPDRLNALSIELAIELDEVLAAVGADNDARVVVLTGSGRAFCSGLDLKDYGVIPNIDGLSVHRIASRSMRVYSQLTRRLRALPQPVVAAVNGPAYGGGMCLALGCDLRIASADATFNATGIVNGLTSTEMGAGWLLPRLIGSANANDLLLTGRRIDAAEALRVGLVSRVVPAADL